MSPPSVIGPRSLAAVAPADRAQTSTVGARARGRGLDSGVRRGQSNPRPFLLQPQPTHQARRLLSPGRRARYPEPESTRLRVCRGSPRAPLGVTGPGASPSEPAGATGLPHLRPPGWSLLGLAPRRDRVGVGTAS